MASSGNPASERDGDQDPRERIVPGNVEEPSVSPTPADDGDEMFVSGPSSPPEPDTDGEMFVETPVAASGRSASESDAEMFVKHPDAEPSAEAGHSRRGNRAGDQDDLRGEEKEPETRVTHKGTRGRWLWPVAATASLIFIAVPLLYHFYAPPSVVSERPPNVPPTPPQPPSTGGAVDGSAGPVNPPPPAPPVPLHLPPVGDPSTPESKETLVAVGKMLDDPGITPDRVSALKDWASQSRSATHNAEVRQMIRLIDALNNTTIDEPLDLESAEEPMETTRSSGAQTKPPDYHVAKSIPQLMFRLDHALVCVLMLTVVTADAASPNSGAQSAPPENIKPEDLEVWNDHIKLWQDAKDNTNVCNYAYIAFRLANLRQKYSQFQEALNDFCLPALTRVNEALQASDKALQADRGLPLQKRQRENLLQEHENLLRARVDLQSLQGILVSRIVTQVGSRTRHIEERANHIDAQAKQVANEASNAIAQVQASRAATQQAVRAWQAMASAEVQQLQERLQAIRQQSPGDDVLKHVANGEARADRLLEQIRTGEAVADFAGEFAVLARGILQLENKVAATEVVAAVITREYVEAVLERIQLPTLEEIGQPSEPAPNDSWTKLLRNAQGEVDWLRKQIEAVDQREFSPDQAQEVRRRLQDLIYDALRLETRKQIAALPRSPTGQPLPPDLVTEERLRTEVKNLQQAIASAAEPLRGELQTQSQNLKETITSGDANVRQEVRSSLAKLESDLNDKSDQLATQVSLTSQKVERLEARLGGVLTGAQSIPAPNVTVASQQYSAGCAAYFSGDMETALTCFLSAVEYQRSNPAYRYYLGLTFKQLGREEEAVNQVRIGRACEERYPRVSVGRFLERIQGPNRQWLEWHRMSL